MGMGHGEEGRVCHTERSKKCPCAYSLLNNGVSASSMVEEDCETEIHTYKDLCQKSQSPWLGTLINT